MRAAGWALVAALGAAGCGGEEAAAVDGGAVDGGADVGCDEVGCGDAALAEDTIVGRLVDEAGAPLVGQVVLACMATICLTTESGAAGAFVFAGYDFAAPVDIAMKTPPAPLATPRRAAALYPFRMEPGGGGLDVGVMRVPGLPVRGAVVERGGQAQAVAVGDGLTLTVRRDEMQPPLGQTLDEIAARRVPVEWLPPLPALGGEALVAVFALHPFGATSRAPVGVRLPSALPAGTRVWFRTVSDLDGTCSAPVPGRADGVAVATDPGAGVAALTWLLVSRAPPEAGD